MADPANRANGIYFGFFNGAWWALLTSFAWPWIMPSAIDRWMYRSEGRLAPAFVLSVILPFQRFGLNRYDAEIGRHPHEAAQAP